MKALQNILAKKTVLLVIVVGAAVSFVIISFSYRSWRAAIDPNEFLRSKIAQVVEENISRLYCARLTWNSEYKGFGLWSTADGGPERRHVASWRAPNGNLV